MRYRQLGRTGLRVSEICMGTMGFGSVTQPPESRRMFDLCLDRGVMFFDTADSGIESEALLGTFIKGHRGSLVIATKVFGATGRAPNDMGLSRKHIIEACEASLCRLDTEYIDLYQVHADDFTTPLEETLAALDRLCRDGKVRYIGASNYGAWRLNEALWISKTRGFERYDCIQALYNLIERGVDAELLPLCREKGVGVLAWSPLAGGWLSGKYRETPEPESRYSQGTGCTMGSAVNRERILDLIVASAKTFGLRPSQVALRWVIDQPGVTSALVGARTTEQLEENLGAIDAHLPRDALAALDECSRPAMLYPQVMEFLSRQRREQFDRQVSVR
jgi:aryl-alcohol dehydrogenase-like predicted oxidoreductase